MANTSSSFRNTFELAWSHVPIGHRLTPNRLEVLDPSSGLVYAPAHFTREPIEAVTDELPDEDWIARSFLEFVRGEIRPSGSRGQMPSEPTIVGTVPTTFRSAEAYLARCEEDLVYSGLPRGLTGADGTMVSRLHALVCHPVLGHDANARSVPVDAFTAQVQPLIDRKLRLQFVLPAFPFKDQNIFRTQAPPGHVDLAELSLLTNRSSIYLTFGDSRV
jgi:hypothetical protein